MATLAVSFPILDGQTAAWRAFMAQLTGARKAEFEASRRGLGVRERTFLQQTHMGDVVIVTLEGDDPAGAFAKFARASDAFTVWFREQVLAIHGVDLGAPPAGPLPELVIDSGAV